MNYTQSIGDIVELQCISKFIELGYECSIPYGNGAKYDFIVDLGDKLIKIQCKSARRVKKKNGDLDNAIVIKTVSQTTNTQKTVRHRYTKKQIDYFATYYNNQVYLIPVEECSTAKTLRFTPPVTNQQNYNKAEDYEIEKIISYSNELIESKKEFDDRVINSSISNYEQKYCLECNSPITEYSKSGLCPICYSKTTRVVERPSREELKDMIRKIPFVKIAEKYKVSDKAIVKWCIAENLPSKKKDIKNLSDEEWIEV